MSSSAVWIFYIVPLWNILWFPFALSLEQRDACLEGSFKRHPEDCSSYFQCLNGEVVTQQCPRQAYFNAIWEVCIIDVNGICATAAGKCQEGQIEAIPGNNCGYKLCVDGELKEKKCDLGSFFNETLNICVIDENGICPSCLEEEIETDPDDCAGYLKCVNGSFVKRKCPRGSYFNSNLMICEIDEDGVCVPKPECKDGDLQEDPEDCAGYLKCINGTLIHEKCSDGSFFNSELKICELDEKGICIPIAAGCLEGDEIVDPEDCSAYLQCINRDWVKKLCSYGSYYHKTLQSCLVDEEGVCIPLSERCAEGELETHPDDCASYMECIDGDFIHQKCVDGSFFDSKTQACVVDEKRVCLK